MRVLMLGWEFPPVISGGLGTACFGLTRALVSRGVEVLFVLPRSPQSDCLPEAEIIGLEPPRAPQEQVAVSTLDEAFAAEPVTVARPAAVEAPVSDERVLPAEGPERAATELGGVEFVVIDADLAPYRRPDERDGAAAIQRWFRSGATGPVPAGRAVAAPGVPPAAGGPLREPAGQAARILKPSPAECVVDLFAEVDRFRHLAARAVAGRPFEVVHAHDWMTFPAAAAIADLSGKPLIAHVHSTEFDRSGHQIDQRIYDVERAGMERADLVIAVSHMTRGILMSRYGVPAEKIAVIYNAVDGDGASSADTLHLPTIKGDEKIVLFLGRITMQKGPEYFLAAARKVLQVYDKVRFVMAGSGDAIARTMQLAAEIGIGEKVIFTGFLEGRDVERIYRSADLYVMPSVSDPFGIASLEAISYDVPVLISRQSGVSEVLQHVLKVDFWDVDEMANKIVAVLRHPPLHATLKRQASYEVRRLSWADSARRCAQAYASAIAALGR